jgi:hypothetical protein
MKRISFCVPFYVPVLRLAICALLVAGASQRVDARENNAPNPSGAIFATGPATGGRLVIQRSPVLGDNVAIAIMIDGQVAGTLVRGRTYDRYITPGRHTLSASPNRARATWRGTLEVQPGKTYSYSASYNVNQLVLTPIGPR